MSSGLDLEQRYRRVLRLLPGYYRDTWEEDMVAAFLDSWLTGDPETDELVLRFCRPSLPEVASVTGLAVRLLGVPARSRSPCPAEIRFSSFRTNWSQPRPADFGPRWDVGSTVPGNGAIGSSGEGPK